MKLQILVQGIVFCISPALAWFIFCLHNNLPAWYMVFVALFYWRPFSIVVFRDKKEKNIFLAFWVMVLSPTINAYRNSENEEDDDNE